MAKGSSFAWGVVLICAAVSANAQTAGVGPYYATPAWDQTLSATTRFIVLTNFGSDAVLDRETGLVWQRTPSAVGQNFRQAFQSCLRATTGGRRGWRLPTISELTSLFDPSATAAPFLPAGQPFVLPADTATFWSSSYYETNFANVRVGTGYIREPAGDTYVISRYTEDTPLVRAWCVRGSGEVGAAPG